MNSPLRRRACVSRAVASLGKTRWPELIARQRKKDFSLDAYAPSSLTPEGSARGLAASITPTFNKISRDAKTAKENFSDLKALLFVTTAKIGNADRRQGNGNQ
jgi:hypothetical protein